MNRASDPVFAGTIAKELGICPALAWRYLKSGAIKGARLHDNKRWSAPRSAVDAFKRKRAAQRDAGDGRVKQTAPD